MEQGDNISSVFAGVWIALSIISFFLFFVNNNAVLKRKMWLPFMTFAGALFVVFVWLMGIPTAAFFVLVPAIILMIYLQHNMTKFCDSCGKTLINYNPFSPQRFCSKCGEKLT